MLQNRFHWNLWRNSNHEVIPLRTLYCPRQSPNQTNSIDKCKPLVTNDSKDTSRYLQCNLGVITLLIPYYRSPLSAHLSSLRCPQVLAIPPHDVKTKTNLRRIACYHDLSLLIVSSIAYMHQNSPILLVSLVLIIFWIDYCICRILRV